MKIIVYGTDYYGRNRIDFGVFDTLEEAALELRKLREDNREQMVYKWELLKDDIQIL